MNKKQRKKIEDMLHFAVFSILSLIFISAIIAVYLIQ